MSNVKVHLNFSLSVVEFGGTQVIDKLPKIQDFEDEHSNKKVYRFALK